MHCFIVHNLALSLANSLENNLWLHLAHGSQREELFCIRGEPSILGLLKKKCIWYISYSYKSYTDNRTK